jgi:lipid-A-disaccharide synthase
MSHEKKISVAVIAGEASGDLHGARVIEAMRHRNSEITVSGAGGTAMKRAGANLVVDAKELSVMGITAVLVKAPQIIKLMMRLKRFLAQTQPDLLMIIDFPDFNIHLAGYAKKLGIPVLYYISPTIWAWRSKRILKIKKRVDHMAVILPFEKPIYEKHNVPVTYVGHPLLDDAAEHPIIHRTHLKTERPTIALLPGSRVDEIRRLLPNMLNAAHILQNHIPNAQFVISRAPSIEESLIRKMHDTITLQQSKIAADPVGKIFNSSDLAIVASGTASLEAAIYGIPTIITYQVSPFSYWLGNKLVEVPHIGLANLIAGKRILPELVQNEATAENMADAAYELLSDPAAYAKMLREIKKIQLMLGQAGASHRVATIAFELLEGRRVS